MIFWHLMRTSSESSVRIYLSVLSINHLCYPSRFSLQRIPPCLGLQVEDTLVITYGLHSGLVIAIKGFHLLLQRFRAFQLQMPGIQLILQSLLLTRFGTVGEQVLEDAAFDLDADLADVLLG